MDPFRLTQSSGDSAPDTSGSNASSSSYSFFARLKSSRIAKVSFMFVGIALLAMVSYMSFSSSLWGLFTPTPHAGAELTGEELTNSGSSLSSAELVPMAPLPMPFNNYFAPSNWTLTNTNANGVFNSSGAPASIILTGGNNGSGNPGTTDLTICAGAGNLSFNWSFGLVPPAPVWHSADQRQNIGEDDDPVALAPFNLSSGDLIIVIVMARDAIGTVSMPTGFNLIRREAQAGNNDNIGFVETFYKIATGSEPANYTFDYNSINDNDTWVVISGRVTGHNAATPIGGHNGTNSGTTSETTITIPQIAAGSVNRLLIAAVSIEDDDHNPISGPAGMTEIAQVHSATGDDISIKVTQETVGSGATGTRAFSWPAGDAVAAQMFTINPNPCTTPPGDDLAYYFVGNNPPVQLVGTNGLVGPIAVNAGEIIGFRVSTLTNQCAPGALTISNFTATGLEGVCNITGPSQACMAQGDLMFSAPGGADSYAWTVVFGDADIVSGQGTNSITVSSGMQTFMLQVTVGIGDCEETCSHVVTAAAPSCTSEVYPPDGGVPPHGVPLNAVLQWDPSTTATSYRVYFGTDNPPTNIANGTDVGNVLMYDPPGLLTQATNYFWRIVPVNACGEATNCPVWSFTSLSATCVAASTLSFCTVCNNSCTTTALANPPMTASCANLRIALVLDESASVEGNTQQVRDGVRAFADALNCTGAQLALIEFRGNARIVFTGGYLPVDNDVVDAIYAYTGNPPQAHPLLNGHSYTPGTGPGTGGTNYQSGMMAVDALTETPDLVLFFTDGDPTNYFTNANPVYDQGGNTANCSSSPNGPQIQNPARVANKLKCEGAHIFALGVAGATAGPLQAVSGNTIWQSGVNSIATADYVVGNFAQLAQNLSEFVEELCPFDSDIISSDICEGSNEGSVAIFIPNELLPYTYTLYNDDNNNVILTGNGNISPLILGGLGALDYRLELVLTVPGSGCTRVQNVFFEIEAGAEAVVVASVVPTPADCETPDEGSVTVTIQSGLAPYSYNVLLNGNSVAQDTTLMNPFTVESLAPGDYTIEIEDFNGCNTVVEPFTIDPATGCCPETCNISGGPGSTANVCTTSGFSVGTTGGTCNEPVVYAWTFAGNTSNAFIVGSASGASVTVNSGTKCGFYVLQSSVTCDGCGPLICTYDTVTVVDLVDPSFASCPANPIALGCNPPVVTEAQAIEAAGTATDNCGTPSVSASGGQVMVDGCNRSQVWTVVAIDSCGNDAECLVTYTWTVVTAPVLAGVPADADLGCNPQALPECSTTVTASNECGSVNVTCTPGSLEPNDCMVTQSFIYSATACGLTTLDTVTYTWSIATAPVLAGVPEDADLGCNPETLPACDEEVTASNECGPVDVDCTPMSIEEEGCFRSQSFIYSATACGLTTSDTVTYTWSVATAPVLAGVPEDADLGCNPPVLPACDEEVAASNECGPVDVDCISMNIEEEGCFRSQSFIYSATACGLTTSDTVTYTWSVATAPVLAGVPADDDLGCTPPVLPTCSTGVTASNECGTVNVSCAPGSVVEEGCTRTQSFVYSATACGLTTTDTTTYTWTVASEPELEGVPDDADLGCNPEVLPSCASVTATDECGSVLVICTPGVIEVEGCMRTQSFVYIATACGLTSTDTTTYTWTVVTAPMLTGVPEDADLGCNPETLPACDEEVMASNECGPVDVDCTPMDIEEEGCFRSQSFIYSATACGLTTSDTVTYTWSVATPPVLTGVPEDTDLGCNPETLPACDEEVTASNECGPVDVDCTPMDIEEEGCFRSQSFIYSATACGLTTSDTVTYTWSVATAPVLAGVPEDADLGCNPPVLPACDEEVAASNECGPVDVDCTPSDIVEEGCFRSQSFIYSATACGLTTADTVTYTWVQDTVGPDFGDCPFPSLVLDCGDENNEELILVWLGSVGALDLCSGDNVTIIDDYDGEGFSDGCGETGSRVVVFTATDACGNESTCTGTIMIQDTMPPTLTCPVDRTIEGCGPLDITNPPYSPSLAQSSYAQFSNATNQGSAEDACGDEFTVQYADESISGSCPVVVHRTWYVTDACGNLSTCVQDISVDDTTPPTIDCPEDLILQCDAGNDHALAISAWLSSVSASDNCSDVTVSNSYNPEGFLPGQECDPISSQVVFFSVIDACGNSTGCSAQIIVVDTVAPVCITQDITVTEIVDPETGMITITADMIDNGSFDGCSGDDVTISVSPSEFTCQDEGDTIVTLTVTDACGNVSTCTAVVTIDCINPCVTLDLWVYLEGATTSLTGSNTHTIPMRTSLNNGRVLPGQARFDVLTQSFICSDVGQPYSGMPWNYPGTEGDLFDSQCGQEPGDAGYPSTVVDWVLVSLRTDEFLESTVFQAAALLHNNGRIELVSGYDYPELCDLDLFASYYVVVQHRNHLLVMSHAPVSIDLADNSKIAYDFRSQQSYSIDPGNPSIARQLEILPGVFAMIGGNADQATESFSDTEISGDDEGSWLSQNGTLGRYRAGDCNMSCDVTFNDLPIIERNNGIFTTVPND